MKADHQDTDLKELSEGIFEYYLHLLEQLKVPKALRELGFTAHDVDQLVEGTFAQQRLLGLSPKTITRRDLEAIFKETV